METVKPGKITTAFVTVQVLDAKTNTLLDAISDGPCFFEEAKSGHGIHGCW